MREENELDWGRFGDGAVHIICSSHNDIAWFDTPAATIEWRDTKSITPALDRMASNPLVRFSMENVLYLLEYLERHPERYEEIRQLVVDKKFDWGATYNQPYESLLSGEQLVRQVYLGRRLLTRLIPGADPRVYHSPDVPARTLQMPQVLAKADVPYMLISRHRPGIFEWRSPDGSRVVAWSMGHYSDTFAFSRTLDGPFPDVVARVHADLANVAEEYERHALDPHFAYLNSADYIGPKDFDSLLEQWDRYRARESAQGRKVPELRYSTPEAFLDLALAGEPTLPVIEGERPNVWVYIHGPGHQQAVKAKREAGSLLRSAEIFHTLAAVAAGSFTEYPAEAIAGGWADSIYDDHGWGGHNGDLTDETFRQTLVGARDSARDLLDDALKRVSSNVSSGAVSGVPIVVFNSLSWERTDIVRCKVPFQLERPAIMTEDGQALDVQSMTPGSGLEREIAFVADKVPPLGYSTFWLVSGSDQETNPVDNGRTVTDQPQIHENRYYKASFGPGGIRALFDKQLGLDVFSFEKFLGGELFMIESVGNGAGEFDSIQQPTSVGIFERMSGYAPQWEISHQGPVYTTYRLKQDFEHCTVVQEITLYESLKRVDFEITLMGWDGTRSKEFRIAFPFATGPEAKTLYEVPLGVVKVGVSEIEGRATDGPVYEGVHPDRTEHAVGPAYMDDNHTIRPREVQDYISSVGTELAATLSSSVAAFDFADATWRPMLGPVIQPILLASRRSCHPRGNWYRQAGDHHFNFSLTTHIPASFEGRRCGVQANHPLEAVVVGETGSQLLPTRFSLLDVSEPNCRISTIKKAEDDDSIIVRCYEVDGKVTDLSLSFPFELDIAGKTNIVEEGFEELSIDDLSIVKTRIGAHAIETFQVRPRSGQ